MGVHNIVYFILGWGSVIAGISTIVMGARLLFIASGGRKGWFGGGTGVDLAADPGKALEALSKLPLWAVAIIVGYLQILVGLWLLGETLFGYSMLP